MTIAGRLSDFALKLDYDSLPPPVVHQAKRALLDSLGCAVGGYSSQASQIMRDWVRELGCRGESTVIGSGLKTSCLHAALANGVMLRYLDYMDTYVTEIPGARPPGNHSGGHQCEVIPGALAIGERRHSSGREIITAIVLGYELGTRFAHGERNTNLEQRGWNVDTRAGIVMPLVAGKLLGLTGEQMENAVGISGGQSPVLGVLDAPGEEYTMAKNLRFPVPACGGLMAALLAEKGFTGPRRVIEGKRGLVQQVYQGEFDIERFTKLGDRFDILNIQVKPFCADNETQGHISATIKLVKEHNVRPEDIERIKLWVTARTLEHTGDPAKRYPTNKETADHSSYYLTAVAITDHAIGPAQFRPEKMSDPKIRELIDKTSIEIDPSLEHTLVGGGVEITTRQGATFTEKVDYFRGHYRNPMTDSELQDKFRGMAAPYFSEAQMQRIIDTVFGLEKLEDVSRLTERMVFSESK